MGGVVGEVSLLGLIDRNPFLNRIVEKYFMKILCERSSFSVWFALIKREYAKNANVFRSMLVMWYPVVNYIKRDYGAVVV